MVISFTLRFMFTLVDTVYAAAIKEDDPDAVAAIGLFIPIQTLFIALWVGLSAGFTTCLSQAFGKCDNRRIQMLKTAMLRINLVLMIVIPGMAGLLYLAIPHMGLTAGLQQSFTTYAMVLILGMPISGFLSIYPDSLVKAHHDTFSTMVAGLWSSLLNISLNTLFVFAFHWGLFGIGLATVLSRYGGLGYAMWRCRRLEAKRLQQDWPETSEIWPHPFYSILLLATPGGMTYLLAFCEEALVAKLLAGMENATVALASWGVYSRFLSLAIMPMVATSVAVLPFVARLVPEGKSQQVRRDLRLALLQTAGLSLLIAIPAGWIFAEPLARFLVPGSTMEKLGGQVNGANFLRLLPLAALSMLPFLILRPVFEATSRARLGILITACKSLLFSCPMILLGYALAPGLGMDPLMASSWGWPLPVALPHGWSCTSAASSCNPNSRQHWSPRIRTLAT